MTYRVVDGCLVRMDEDHLSRDFVGDEAKRLRDKNRS